MKLGEANMSPGHSAGYVYVASNPKMPGLIKAGRTQTSVYDRLRNLYSTGVPCSFVSERERFFVDCLEAEQSFFKELSAFGERCENREFFTVDKIAAGNLLDELYRRQYLIFSYGKHDFENFEGIALECFRKVHALNHADFVEKTARAVEILPFARRDSLRLIMLAHVLSKRDESFAITLVKNYAVDPEVPMPDFIMPLFIREYYLTAHEFAVYFKLSRFERYLESIGCDIRNSSALGYVVDTLINTNINEEAQDILVEFGANLIKRGVDTGRILNVANFIDSPIASSGYKFNVFPRNSNQCCADVIRTLAGRNDKFAMLGQLLP